MLSYSQWDVHQGDCLAGLAEIADNTVDFVFADPPYFLSNGGFTVSNGRQVSVNKGSWDVSSGFQDDIDFHKAWIEAIKPKLKKSGTIAISGTYHSIYKCGYVLELLGFRILNELIWFKPNGAPNLGGRNFTASHETIIWASLHKGAKHKFNYVAMKEFDAPKDKLRRPGTQMRSVWSIANTPRSEKQYGKHPTQKPMALLERLILACTDPGDLVLDPFLGSGTTGVAAVKHGRNFIGFEIDAEYTALARKRIGSVFGGDK